MLKIQPPAEPDGYRYGNLPRVSYHIVSQHVKFYSREASNAMEKFKILANEYREATSLDTSKIISRTINGREVLNRIRNKMVIFDKLLTSYKTLTRENFPKFVELFMAFRCYTKTFNTVFIDAKPFTGEHISNMIMISKKIAKISNGEVTRMTPSQLQEHITIMLQFMINTYLKLYNEWRRILTPYCRLYALQQYKYNEVVRVYGLVEMLHICPTS